MPLMSWQLWLAKDLVVEKRLPWQSAIISLTPGRVAQCLAGHPPRCRGDLSPITLLE